MSIKQSKKDNEVLIYKAEKSYYLTPPSSRGHQFWVQEWNSNKKQVILFVHGFPGCSDQAELMTMSPLLSDVRLIAIDRPGYNKSAFQKGITPLSFAKQIVEILDFLHVDNVYILSVSGGAPFSMAIALLLKNRVLKLTSIAGVAPLTRKNFKYMNRQQRRAWYLTQLVPRPALELILQQIWKRGLDRIDDFLFTNVQHFSAPDQEVLKHKAVSPLLTESLKAALSQGPKGIVQDLKIYANRWQLPLHEIQCPVTLWHGTHDDVVHVAYCHEMQSRIKRAEIKLIPNEGHYSIAMNYRDAILSDLLSMGAKD